MGAPPANHSIDQRFNESANPQPLTANPHHFLNAFSVAFHAASTAGLRTLAISW
jgi:hypothetical protein